MAVFRCCVVGLLLSCCFVRIVLAQKQNLCSDGDTVQLESGVERNDTCGTVEGRVQICEEGEWRNLCDSMWTVQDARVACLSLNYSGIGKEQDMKQTVASL